MSRAQTTAFRVWVRRHLRCRVCGRRGPDPHHVRAIGMGGTRFPEAADENNVVPLCRAHHTEVHQAGRHTFAERHGLDLAEEARFTWGRWEALPEEEREHWREEAA